MKGVGKIIKGRLSYNKKEKNMAKIYYWCGFHEVPMSRCDNTHSFSCQLLKLDKKQSDALKAKKNKEGYNISNRELTTEGTGWKWKTE